MKIKKVIISLFVSAMLALPVFSQTEVAVIASNNGSINSSGPTGNPWYHNSQGPGDYAVYSISSFTVAAADFGGDAISSIESVSISYTQANASFTADGPVEFFITFDPAASAGDYAGLVHNSVGTGIDDANFADSPSTLSLGTFTFTQVENGTVDTYELDISNVKEALMAAINAPEEFSIIIASSTEGVAATYAGIQSNSYPDSIILTVTASAGEATPEPVELTEPAINNESIKLSGASGSPWYHNAQGPGDYAAYGIATFELTPEDMGGTVQSIEELAISYTQANASFTADGPLEFYVTYDADLSAENYATLIHSGVGSGVNDAEFDDAPSTQSVGTSAFVQVESGTVDTYILDLSSQQDALVAAINGGMPFSIILSSSTSGTAATYAGIQNNTYPDSITVSISASVIKDSVDPEPEESDLMITGVMDGSLPGGLPKGIELYALADIPDLSIYGLGSANNGGGTDGEEITLEGSVAAGDFIYVATEETEFMNVWGMMPDFVSDSAAINGDDAIELFLNGVVVDVFGEIDVDGNGTAWEYLDSWAYRTVEGTPDGTFVLENWTFGGVDALDGLDAAGIAEAVPFGTYLVVDYGDPAMMITGVMDGPLPGGLPKAIELYVFADIADLSGYGVGSANNGGGTDGIEINLEGSATAGDFIYIASDETEFTNVWGIAPDYVSDAAAINGDDAIELFLGDEVIDVFGEIDVDGNGTAWEYLDSWAYRTVEGTPDGTFVIENWTFGGVDALDGLDAAGVTEAVPFGYYPNPIPVAEPLPWEDAVSGDSIISPWFGAFEFSDNGWIDHSELLWIYVGYVTDVESMWIYSLYLDTWVWSSMDTWPYVYNSSTGGWTYYFNVPDVGIWAYDLNTRLWTFYPLG